MIEIKLKLPTALSKSGDWKRILPRFQEEAGKLIVQAIRDVLGSSEIYTLTPEYSQKKISGKVGRLKRVGGKAADQPLILTGAMYEALQYRKVGDVLIIEVKEGESMSGDEDYAAIWEEKTEFMEKGLEEVEGKLDELLLRIVFDEMRL